MFKKVNKGKRVQMLETFTQCLIFEKKKLFYKNLNKKYYISFKNFTVVHYQLK